MSIQTIYLQILRRQCCLPMCAINFIKHSHWHEYWVCPRRNPRRRTNIIRSLLPIKLSHQHEIWDMAKYVNLSLRCYISCKLQTADVAKFSSVLILHPEAPPFSTKQQRVGIFNKRHCICVFFFVPLAYMYPQLNHIFASHCEIFIGKSKWAGR